jgi:glycosyltransferase involved in cell wall biosynthesis
MFDSALFLIDGLHANGPSRLVVALAVGFRARGLDVRVAHLSRNGWPEGAEQLRDGGVPVLDLELRRLADPRPALRLASYLRREGIRVLHTHNGYAHLVGRSAAALASCPLVSTDHWYFDTDTCWRGRVRRRLDLASARLSGGDMIMVSEAQRRAHERAGRMRGARVHTVPNGVDTAMFRPDRAARRRTRERLALRDDTPVLLNVAAFRPEKGHRHLLRAMALLAERVPAAHLLIAGDGAERGRLEGEARVLGVAGRVTFLGARPDVPDLLAAADAYVHPADWESHPMAILEAMAAGLPVVATAYEGALELVDHGANAMVVPTADPPALADAMERALGAEGAALGLAARAWAERLGSIDACLERHAAVYRIVLDRRTAAGARAT